MFNLLAVGLLVVLVSAVGGLFAGRQTETWINKHLSYLVAFSAGVFLVTAGLLTIEVFHIFTGHLVWGIAFIILGYLGGWLVSYLWPDSHHHHDPHELDHVHNSASARKIIIGDAFHNISDGIMLASVWLITPALGWGVVLAVVIHETLQEMSEFFVMKQAGYTNRKALLINLLVATTIFIGMGLVYFNQTTPLWSGILLALSSGFFFHVVKHDLLPKPSAHAKKSKFFQHLLVSILGAVLMFGTLYLTSEEHAHEEIGQATHD